jgi:hypothetical protein
MQEYQLTCEDCGRSLSDATGWYKQRIRGVYHWYCLQCSGMAKACLYPSITLLHGWHR